MAVSFLRRADAAPNLRQFMVFPGDNNPVFKPFHLDSDWLLYLHSKQTDTGWFAGQSFFICLYFF